MKKILLVLLFMVNLSSIYSLDVIDINMTLEIGMIPRGHMRIYDFTKHVFKDLSFYGDFKVESQMFDNHLYFGAGTKIYLWKLLNGLDFKPDASNFVFFAGLRFGDAVEIFFRHYCFHPIKAWDRGSSTNIEGWSEEIGIKLNFKLCD